MTPEEIGNLDELLTWLEGYIQATPEMPVRQALTIGGIEDVVALARQALALEKSGLLGAVKRLSRSTKKIPLKYSAFQKPWDDMHNALTAFEEAKK